MENPEPLVLADGTKINVKTGEIIEEEVVEQNSASTDNADSETTNLALVGPYKYTDLPESGKLMAVISAICAMELWGLSSLEISHVLDTEPENVESISASESYIEFKQGIMRNVMRALADDVRGIFAKHAKQSANKLVSAMQGKKVRDMEMAAAESILNRGGFGEKSVVEHNHRMEDELIIRVVKDTGNKNLPTIDL